MMYTYKQKQCVINYAKKKIYKSETHEDVTAFSA